MPTTRLQFETLLVGPDMLSGRVGRRMKMVRLYDPATAVLGAIPALADPIAEGLRANGTPPIDPTAPTDFDLMQLADSRLSLALDVAELRCLESVLGNWDQCDQKIANGEQKLGQLADGIRQSIETLRKRLADQYGYGRRRSRPAAGAITVGSAWPPGPPPPVGPAPYPQTDYPNRSGTFNP